MLRPMIFRRSINPTNSFTLKNLFFGILAVSSLFLYSCSENKAAENQIQTTALQYKKGDIVPADQVCMVNNAYMGKKQFEVEFEGKTYFGCCENCQKRIPTETSARIAIDPITGKGVDKATAVIAITGDRDEVMYFESKESFAKYKSGITN